jgi:hypothetical protein
MKRILVLVSILALMWLVTIADHAIGGRRGGGGGGRGGGGRGGGGFSGGGFSGGGGYGGGYRGGGAVGSYGAGAGARSSTPIVGPGGGTGQAGRGGGSYTTKGGSTIDYKGGAVGGTSPGGVQGGKYVGGIQVTTPGGREATKVGGGAAVAGPGGNVVGGKAGATVGSGPQGSIASKYQGGVAIGPQGGVAGGSRVGAASGPGGTAVGGSRGAIASGPYGAAAGRTTVASGARGTYYRSTTAIRGQGVAVRQAVAGYGCFRPGWYVQHPGAWAAAGWAAGAVWRAATWGACSDYCGCGEEAAYYDYGENVVYQDDGVYFNGEKVYGAEEYAEQATAIAETGKDAKVSQDEDWLPLGVFAMVQGDEKTSNHIFQLAVNKGGVLRGNYYDAVLDTTAQVSGSVNKQSQRAAWTVGDRKTPVYEAGIANLTQNETTMIVHYGKDRSQQFTLIRIEEPEKTAEK